MEDNIYDVRRTFDPRDVARQTDKHMHKLPCFWPEDWVRAEQNYSIIDDHNNVGLLDYQRPMIYEAHMYFEDRGGEALHRLKEMIRWIFTETDALLLVGKTPVLEKGAWMMARLAGFKRVGNIETEFGPMHMSTLSKENWLEQWTNRMDS